MKFCGAQLSYFGATEGAYSHVTENEWEKGQITIVEDEGEVDVLINSLGKKNIPRTPDSWRTTVITISRAGEVKHGSLKINFPKLNKDELRIYRNQREGFDFLEGDIWFIFRKRGVLTVGSMPIRKWNRLF